MDEVDGLSDSGFLNSRLLDRDARNHGNPRQVDFAKAVHFSGGLSTALEMPSISKDLELFLSRYSIPLNDFCLVYGIFETRLREFFTEKMDSTDAEMKALFNECVGDFEASDLSQKHNVEIKDALFLYALFMEVKSDVIVTRLIDSTWEEVKDSIDTKDSAEQAQQAPAELSEFGKLYAAIDKFKQASFTGSPNINHDIEGALGNIVSSDDTRERLEAFMEAIDIDFLEVNALYFGFYKKIQKAMSGKIAIHGVEEGKELCPGELEFLFNEHVDTLLLEPNAEGESFLYEMFLSAKNDVLLALCDDQGRQEELLD